MTSWLAQAQAAQRDVHIAFQDVWSFVLFGAGEKTVTVGKVVLVLVYLILANLVALRVRRALRERVLPGFRVMGPEAAALSQLTYYVLVLLLTLVALHLVHIPLTLFTFLGGGVAIAVGFGAQAIIGNFLGGLILIFERPIRIGDLVEIDGTTGLVDAVGPRCTHVVTSDGIHLLVPNSKLLQESLVNWTLSGGVVRTSVQVGVAYGSPVDRVRQILLDAAADHPRIHAEPPPVVLFTDFGDNSLVFQVLFWLKVERMMDRRTVESELRFELCRRFAEAGISLPFPQRDLHVRTERPIEVRVSGAVQGAAD
ncbi:MAG: mechanosensitive ion channel domain-containing protein, partial [Candidatus Eremiobacterota bacterium]